MSNLQRFLLQPFDVHIIHWKAKILEIPLMYDNQEYNHNCNHFCQTSQKCLIIPGSLLEATATPQLYSEANFEAFNFRKQKGGYKNPSLSSVFNIILLFDNSTDSDFCGRSFRFFFFPKRPLSYFSPNRTGTGLILIWSLLGATGVKLSSSFSFFLLSRVAE